MVKALTGKYGSDAVFIFGDWSVANKKFQQPVPGKSWRRLLAKHGFEVYLINEFKTSSICPRCWSALSTLKKVKDPRPYMKKKYPTVRCNGLLHCENNKCRRFETKDENGAVLTKRYTCSVWNRDMAAVLNFRHTLRHLREYGCIADRFKYKSTITSSVAGTVPAAAVTKRKDRSLPSSSGAATRKCKRILK